MCLARALLPGFAILERVKHSTCADAQCRTQMPAKDQNLSEPTHRVLLGEPRMRAGMPHARKVTHPAPYTGLITAASCS
jgi:hypothetical protein